MGQEQSQEGGLRSPGRCTDPGGDAPQRRGRDRISTLVDRDANPEGGLEEADRWGCRAVGLIDLSEWTRPRQDDGLVQIQEEEKWSPTTLDGRSGK